MMRPATRAGIALLLVVILLAGCLGPREPRRFDPATDALQDDTRGASRLAINVTNVGNHSIDVVWTLTHPSGAIVDARTETLRPDAAFEWARDLNVSRAYRLLLEASVLDDRYGGHVTLERDLHPPECQADEVRIVQTVDTTQARPVRITTETAPGFCDAES